MARFVLTAEAKKDLDEIWQYVAAESEIAADKVIVEIIQRFPRLSKFPEMGRERTELAAGMRSLTVGRLSTRTIRSRDSSYYSWFTGY